MSNIAIKVQNLSKVYKLYDKPIDRLKESLHPLKKKYHKEFYALNDVSFEIKKGETVGIIGKNGAGKSTLLKIITGVLTPSSGHIHVNGRIASLLELGAGFNPEYTGVENIYLQGTLMGYNREEMEEKIDAILKFADIGDFVHQQVKTYSSGMFARLAFAVAINVDPDILIVDEVLSVGDARFQAKSIKKMESIKKKGTTILFVSHGIEQVKRFCQKAIWIDKGKIRQIGDQASVGDMYTDSLHLESLENSKDEEKSLIKKNTNTSTQAKIVNFSLEKKEIEVFDSLIVTIKYEVFDEYIDGLLLGVAIFDSERNYIFGPNTYLDKYEIISDKGVHILQYEIPKIPLTAGTYFLDVGIFVEKGIVNLDYHQNIESFKISSDYFTEGRVYLEHNWKQ
ncbi:ABC transporter ATP-binding protein [Aliarcobacter butzleri]|uniref:ABC transporter ATP-binding protein n=1 Tax=Aliarcobacter butzleri TaxID=28197 RepID=UPI0021B4396E|nr:ABC transporter ATP-binding protein [Aliarcobacter butzleri]MCT7593182.1 ABC transporter ATP-binding protein [Aliarcobacter butzleri]MCT7633074.1 ABC transporter ATP-binding protein [Aliarcobacter butzleri]